ncbi:MAG TPA: hypothetical protein VEI94_11585 [Candidatus Bathyarchaeia archaeon]|nr:hypothetical protein [Candidatus Bathyarchaeia archaeon]
MPNPRRAAARSPARLLRGSGTAVLALCLLASSGTDREASALPGLSGSDVVCDSPSTLDPGNFEAELNGQVAFSQRQFGSNGADVALGGQHLAWQGGIRLTAGLVHGVEIGTQVNLINYDRFVSDLEDQVSSGQTKFGSVSVGFKDRFFGEVDDLDKPSIAFLTSANLPTSGPGSFTQIFAGFTARQHFTQATMIDADLYDSVGIAAPTGQPTTGLAADTALATYLTPNLNPSLEANFFWSDVKGPGHTWLLSVTPGVSWSVTDSFTISLAAPVPVAGQSAERAYQVQFELTYGFHL